MLFGAPGQEFGLEPEGSPGHSGGEGPIQGVVGMWVAFGRGDDAEVPQEAEVLGNRGAMERQEPGKLEEGSGTVGIQVAQEVDSGGVGKGPGPLGLVKAEVVEGRGFGEGHGGWVS